LLRVHEHQDDGLTITDHVGPYYSSIAVIITEYHVKNNHIRFEFLSGSEWRSQDFYDTYEEVKQDVLEAYGI
jgi:hypothetical protein